MSEFDAEFQRHLVMTTVHDPGVRLLVSKFTETGQLAFTDPACSWAWTAIRGDEVPSVAKLRMEARRTLSSSPARLGIDALLGVEAEVETAYVQTRVVAWARQQVFRTGFEESREAWNAGRMDDAYTAMRRRMDELAEIDLAMADRGWFFEEITQCVSERNWSSSRSADGVPSGLKELDRVMKGGIQPGQLEVCVAYSGIGKSFWCVHRGFVAARCRMNVMHFILEGSRASTEERYDARFMAESMHIVRANGFDGDTLREFLQEAKSYRQSLVTRSFSDKPWSTSITDLQAELAELRTLRKWVPDLIIVDYGDLLHAPGENEYQRQKTAFRQLHSLAEKQAFPGHRGYAVLSPSQAQRPTKGADTKLHWLRQGQISDSYEKVRVADYLLTLNRTNEEKEQGKIRLLLDKNRHGEDNVRIIADSDYPKAALVVLGSDAVWTAAA